MKAGDIMGHEPMGIVEEVGEIVDLGVKVSRRLGGSSDAEAEPEES